ncbi:hypothetical protein GCM10022206_19510 [Streptomyces chiangmaiensis]
MCAGCGAELTAPLSQVSLPVHARQKYGNGAQLPVLMQSGTFAVDPDPWGGPWRMWDEIDPGEAEARGIYAPVYTLSDSTPGASVIAPGDIRGTRLIPEKRGGACCGLDGADGPNMACEACDLPVATRVDDCSLWQAVRLSSDAVHRIPQDVLRDDPLPLLPNYLFRADRGTFQHTLVRLPAVRSPWLRTMLENLTHGTSADLF